LDRSPSFRAASGKGPPAISGGFYARLDVWMHATVYEPNPRLCGGEFGYVVHRFAIKGGLSWRDVMLRQATNSPRLLRLMTNV
jgi:hypothetical protein